jgi:protein-L-isoaspartate(D-aspartate) O-methyltransferase
MEPFDAIIVTAAAPHIPSPLTSQLCKEGGRLVVPVGSLKSQHLYVIRRDGDYHSVERSVPVRFVPLVGRYGFKDAELPHNKRDPNPPASVE